MLNYKNVRYIHDSYFLLEFLESWAFPHFQLAICHMWQEANGLDNADLKGCLNLFQTRENESFNDLRNL